MLAFLKELLDGRNHFASGGLVLMVLGSAGVILRELPQTLWRLLVRQTTLMITVKDDDAAFQWVKEWFLDQNFLKRIRRVDLDTTLRGSELSLIPAPGDHWFRYRGRLFCVSFHRSEDTKGARQRRVESLTFKRSEETRQRYGALSTTSSLATRNRKTSRPRFTCTTTTGTAFKLTLRAA